MALTDSEIITAFSVIQEEDIDLHRKKMKKRIKKAAATGLSSAGIARKLDISRSIVRDNLSG